MLPCQTHQLPIIHQDVPIDALLVKVNLGFKKKHAMRAYVEANAPGRLAIHSHGNIPHMREPVIYQKHPNCECY